MDNKSDMEETNLGDKMDDRHENQGYPSVNGGLAEGTSLERN